MKLCVMNPLETTFVWHYRSGMCNPFISSAELIYKRKFIFSFARILEYILAETTPDVTIQLHNGHAQRELIPRYHSDKVIAKYR